MDMTEVKAFNAELSALYDNKPPISKAKMNAITRGAIKAIKFYKHAVHSVEKFILKCKPEYKIPGLYVIDSIVRQSRHQFGSEKDVFAPRFAKNMQQTFINLLRCPPEDKRNIIRVLNLWQKNNVFTPEVIQPLFDMVDPNHPIHQELLAQQVSHNDSMVSGNADEKNSPALPSHAPVTSADQSRQQRHDSNNQSTFNRRLLNVDFEYESEDDGIAAADSSPPGPDSALPSHPPHAAHPTHAPHNYLLNPLSTLQALHPQDTLGSILTNPEILRQLQSIQAQMMVANFPMQGVNMNMQQDNNVGYVDTSQPPPMIHTKEENAGGTSPLMDEVNNESDIEFVDDAGPQVIEIDGNDSRSPSPKSSRRRRSRSRERSRRSRSRSRRGSRSRSRDRRRRSRDRASRDRSSKTARDREKDKEKEKEREKDKERDRERRKKGLPPIRKENLTVCSTTLWVGHLSKLVQAEELSDAFGAIGDVISIDLVPPRGCAFIVMNRRRDAARAFTKLNKHKMHGKAITVAWAPGKGVKGREWKDYWEVEAGACYVPWERLPATPSEAQSVLDLLEEGGMLDEDTLPPWLQRNTAAVDVNKTKAHELSGLPPGLLAAASNPSMMVISPLTTAQNLGVDTSCLPPMAPMAPLPPLSFAAHPALPLPLPLLGFKPTAQPAAGLQQALHLQAVLAHHQQQHQQQQLAAQLLLAPPPRVPPHPHQLPMNNTMPPLLSSTESRQDDMDLDTAEEADEEPKVHKSDMQLSQQFKALVANPPPSFNIPPPAVSAPGLLGPGLLGPPPPLLSQPPPSLLGDPPVDKRDREVRRDRERRDRNDRGDRTRDRHDRDRDRDRDRERDRERGDRPDRADRDKDRERGANEKDKERDRGDRDRGDKDRERGDKDRDRDRDRNGRNNRWGARGDNRGSSPSVAERTLQDRLWEMANGPGARPHRDSPPRTNRNRNKDHPDGLLGDGPDADRRKGFRPQSPGQGLLGPPVGPMPMAGLMGPVGPPGPPGPLMGRSTLPPVAPFRIGRDDMRMRGVGPRGPGGPMRPGMWMDGPAPFGPRFNGEPPFNRPSFDGPPFDVPQFDGPQFDRPQFDGPPFDGPQYDRSFDGPSFDRPFDRPHFDGPNRPPFDGSQFDRAGFDGPSFDGPSFNEPGFDGPRFDGSSDAFFDRGSSRGLRGSRTDGKRPRDRDGGSREGREGRESRDGHGSREGREGREGRGDRPPRTSRWAGSDAQDEAAERLEVIQSKTETVPEGTTLAGFVSEHKQNEPESIDSAKPIKTGDTVAMEIDTANVINISNAGNNLNITIAPSSSQSIDMFENISTADTVANGDIPIKINVPVSLPDMAVTRDPETIPSIELKQLSPSLVHRSLSPVQHQCPTPTQRRSPSPVQRRSFSPVQHQPSSPVKQRSPLSEQCRSPLPKAALAMESEGRSTPCRDEAAVPEAGAAVPTETEA